MESKKKWIVIGVLLVLGIIIGGGIGKKVFFSVHSEHNMTSADQTWTAMRMSLFSSLPNNFLKAKSTRGFNLHIEDLQP